MPSRGHKLGAPNTNQLIMMSEGVEYTGRDRAPPLPAALVRRGNAQAADQSFSLLTWQILTLHSCVGAAVNGFGGYRECRSCGRRGHCGVWWGSWQMHGRNCTVAPAILAHIEMASPWEI
jgi:hypothetical protein